MMYNQSLAVAIKNNGKVLREFNKDTVYLPFGSEYSILIKNLNTVRAIVHVTIDGKNVTRQGLVVNAGSEVELERTITENLTKGNKFKFIERNDAVEAARGVKLEDGIIRIEYQFEKIYNWQPIYYYTGPYWIAGSGTSTWTSSGPLVGSNAINTSATSGSPLRSKGVSTSSAAAAYGALNNAKVSYNASEQLSASGFVENDAGITVPGSQSNQKFTEVSDFPLVDTKHVMIFKILGETADNKAVRKPVTVKAKQKCSTCGRNNKAHAKFCSACGTALEVFA